MVQQEDDASTSGAECLKDMNSKEVILHIRPSGIHQEYIVRHILLFIHSQTCMLIHKNQKLQAYGVRTCKCCSDHASLYSCTHEEIPCRHIHEQYISGDSYISFHRRLAKHAKVFRIASTNAAPVTDHASTSWDRQNTCLHGPWR